MAGVSSWRPRQARSTIDFTEKVYRFSSSTVSPLPTSSPMQDASDFALAQTDQGIHLRILRCEAQDVRPVERIPRLSYLWLGPDQAIGQWKLCLEGLGTDLDSVKPYRGTLICSAVKLLPDSDVGKAQEG